MERVYVKLLEILGREKETYATILEQSTQKKEALVKNDVATLEKIVSVEQNLVRLVTDVEQERLAETRRIAADMGCPQEEMTIQYMIDHSEEPETSELIRLKKELGGILGEQMRLNDINTDLLQTQLNYISYMINVSTTPPTLSNVYTATGSEPESDSRLKLFDHQI